MGYCGESIARTFTKRGMGLFFRLRRENGEVEELTTDAFGKFFTGGYLTEAVCGDEQVNLGYDLQDDGDTDAYIESEIA